MTSCPGKRGRDLWGRRWSRDLAADVAVLRDWGADVVVTLVEDHELELLHVPTLGEAIRAAGMQWRHAPIPDMHVPDARFEEIWPGLAAELADVVARGGRVVLHCRAGLGRAGMVAALLAIDLGDTPGEALHRVRSARHGVIQTPGQRRYVARYRPAEPPQQLHPPGSQSTTANPHTWTQPGSDPGEEDVPRTPQ